MSIQCFGISDNNKRCKKKSESNYVMCNKHGGFKLSRKNISGYEIPNFSMNFPGKLGELIGSGGFAKVYAVKNNSKLAFKIQRNEIEYEINTEMSNRSISPEIYGFYNNGFLMERYDYTLKEYLEKYTDLRWVKYMVNRLINRIAKEDIICVDLKDDNIVVNVTNGKMTSLKLIDFSDGYCANVDGDPPIEFIKLVMFMQLNELSSLDYSDKIQKMIKDISASERYEFEQFVEVLSDTGRMGDVLSTIDISDFPSETSSDSEN